MIDQTSEIIQGRKRRKPKMNPQNVNVEEKEVLTVEEKVAKIYDSYPALIELLDRLDGDMVNYNERLEKIEEHNEFIERNYSPEKLIIEKEVENVFLIEKFGKNNQYKNVLSGKILKGNWFEKAEETLARLKSAEEK